MKLIVALILLSAVAINGTSLQEMFTVIESCMENFSVDMSEMDENPEVTEEEACFSQCALEGWGFVQNGQLNKDKAVNSLNEVESELRAIPDMEEMVEGLTQLRTCILEVDSPADTKCGWGYVIAKCFK